MQKQIKSETMIAAKIHAKSTNVCSLCSATFRSEIMPSPFRSATPYEFSVLRIRRYAEEQIATSQAQLVTSGSRFGANDWLWGEIRECQRIQPQPKTRLPARLIRSRRRRWSSKIQAEARSLLSRICPAVMRRTEHWHQESVAHLKLTVIDSDGSTNSR
jgi:hypothetical protein